MFSQPNNVGFPRIASPESETVYPRSQKAFTLVEILVVVMVLLVIAAAAIPYVTGTADTQVLSAARVLASDLQYAQSQAITTQAPVTVVFQTNQNSYTLSNASGPLVHPITRSTYTVNYASASGMQGVVLASASFGGAASVTYDELGSPSSAGTVRLQAGSYVYQIQVASATGKITVSLGP